MTHLNDSLEIDSQITKFPTSRITIVSIKNIDVNKFNEEILKTLPCEQGQVYLNADAVTIGNVKFNEGFCVTTEFLNGINQSVLPSHQLTVKVGCVMMLLSC